MDNEWTENDNAIAQAFLSGRIGGKENNFSFAKAMNEELTAANKAIVALSEALETAKLWIDPFDVPDAVNTVIDEALKKHAIKADKGE